MVPIANKTKNTKTAVCFTLTSIRKNRAGAVIVRPSTPNNKYYTQYKGKSQAIRAYFVDLQEVRALYFQQKFVDKILDAERRKFYNYNISA